MDKITYFESPKQVLYWDIDGDHYIGGIALGDKIICGCCGGIMSIDEINECAPEGIKPILVWEYWVDINWDGPFACEWEDLVSKHYTLDEIKYLAAIYTCFTWLLP